MMGYDNEIAFALVCLCVYLSVSVSVDYITVFFIEDNMCMHHGVTQDLYRCFTYLQRLGGSED